MSQQEPEMGKWEPNPSEPREPFLPDEGFEAADRSAPNLSGLHLPKKPVTKEGVKNFLIELRPLAEEIQSLSRSDQHTIFTRLQKLTEEIEKGEFPKELAAAFDKLVHHFGDLLRHSSPADRDRVLSDIEQASATLGS